MKPTINIKPGESTSMVFIRLYRHIRTLSPGNQPGSHYASHVRIKQATRRPGLRVVK